MKNQTNFVIERTSLIRGIYRALLQSDRTYAAFDPKQVIPLVEKLVPRKLILDPMAGYGSLITFCSKVNPPVSSFSIECNPPAYLWQILINPINAEIFIKFIESIKNKRKRWPQSSMRAISARDWFPSESIRLLLDLWTLCYEVAKRLSLRGNASIEFPLAFLLPFVGRLSSNVQGNVVPHVKKGGLCIYADWQDDFYNYLSFLQTKLAFRANDSKGEIQESLLADCMTVKLPSNKFPSMITSPPYPNSRDYDTMFGPENAFLQILEEHGIINGFTLKQRLIGSPCVSELDGSLKKTPEDVKSLTAKSFLNTLTMFKGSKRAVYDEKIYYIPFFSKYFFELEKAYENISPSLCKNFEGYIIVVNNTHRKQIVPVAQSVLDIWRGLGFDAEIEDKYTRELPHVGGINPKVKGFTARHTEYTIRIYR